MIVVLCVLVVGVLRGISAALPCLDDDYVPCYDDKFCIYANRWCDGFSDCMDNSDEENCAGGEYSLTEKSEATTFSEQDPKGLDGITMNALKRAAEYILSERNPNDDWGAFTPRAIIALAFASRASVISEQEKQLLQQRLNIALLFNLMHNTAGSPCNLALYINALYATCQDPRNFNGIDLVARLRARTEAAKKTGSALPLPLLTLCLANDIKADDGVKLVNMYNNGNEKNKPGYKALTVMAMICYSKKEKRDYPSITHYFSTELGKTDIYSEALLMQALIASGSPVSPEELAIRQEPDGSFGNLLSTYYWIPVLMNSSLLDLPCKNPTYTVSRLQNLLMNDNAEQQQIILSIWINGDTKDVRSYSLTLSFDGPKYLYDVMLMAAERDPLYRFLYSENRNGKVVYNLANIPSDVESRKSWELYTGTIGKVVLNSDKNLQLQDLGIDRIKAKNGTQYIFWLKRT